MGLSENVVYPIVPNGFADHYPPKKMAISLGILTQHFQTNPNGLLEVSGVLTGNPMIYVYHKKISGSNDVQCALKATLSNICHLKCG